MTSTSLNQVQLELLKLFEGNQTAEDLIALRALLNDFLKKKSRNKDKILEKSIIKRVRERVLAIDPKAKVIIFGSRARGDARKDSDWDFLILTGMELTFALKTRFRDSLYDIELETGEVIGTLIFNIEDWNKNQHSNIHKNIADEGIEIFL